MLGVLFIGSCDVCTGCLLTLEVELCKADQEGKVGELEKLLEGKCNMSSLVT